VTLVPDIERVTRQLAELASISDAPAPAVTRVVFTDTDLRARRLVKAWCTDAGLEVREDAVGNTFARLAGLEPHLPPVATGSHIDAIPNAGAYDGTVGVIGAIEALRLVASGRPPRRPIDLVLFTSEEPTRFGIGCLGSRLMSGSLDPSAAAQLTDGAGLTLETARTEAGFIGALESVALPSTAYAAFVELHIEQGPLLEQRGVDIGIVTAIAAPASLRVRIDGSGGHAGAVLMPERRDAFLAAAEIALAVEEAARSTGAIDTVGTTGVCHVFPGAINSVPSRTTIEIDVRDVEGARRDGVLTRIARACDEVARRRRVVVATEVLNADPPARSDAAVVAAITRGCEARQVSYDRMISRAYHDSLFMSRIAPTAMIFIPCRGGVSHRPDEYASPRHIATGIGVLADTLVALAS
jgi:N-carbamoyl-L-amino-acid hydrolase